MLEPLTPIEIEVLTYLKAGYTTREIADLVYYSVDYVRGVRRTFLPKAGRGKLPNPSSVRQRLFVLEQYAPNLPTSVAARILGTTSANVIHYRHDYYDTKPRSNTTS